MAALSHTPLLLEAEPGAGKSTLAPLWALAQAPAGQQVWVIQPRVLAAQALAQRLAQLVGEPVGRQVGYQVPYDARMSADTRLVLMTPGVLLQHLLQNPTLDAVACVMLDEIHERSVNQDLAWALLQEVQILREDLQLVLMSATPDPALQQRISQRLFAPGRCFPVSVQYLPAQVNSRGYSETLSEHLLRALKTYPAWTDNCCLVFLPGWRDIEACAQALIQQFPGHPVYRLHSQVSSAEQLQALDPAQGPRIILATNIAETSLTIADVTLVIDSGLARRADYEQRTGIQRLRTARISMASAEQRRGRAGRVQAGHCIRLWSQDQPLAAADLPEIRSTDYLPLMLRIAHWGSPAKDLPWLEAPNSLALQFAQDQLQRLNLITTQGSVTPAGEQVSALGTHPRLAAFLLLHQGAIPRAALLLALALHFDQISDQGLEDCLREAAQELARNRHWQKQYQRWLSVLSLSEQEEAPIDPLIAARAFQDRIGYKQPSGRYRLNSGISVEAAGRLDSPWAVFLSLQPQAKRHLGVGMAVSLSADQQRELSQRNTELTFKGDRWQEHTRWTVGGVVIDEQWQSLTSDAAEKLTDHIRQLALAKGLDSFAWSPAARALLARARLLQTHGVLELPPLDDTTLISRLDRWLQPFLHESSHLDRLPWHEGLGFYLGYEHTEQIATLLPQHIQLPSGRQVALEFTHDGSVQVAAKLQEFFGCEQLQLGAGIIPLKIHLLSPNGSPLAITTNLRTFWQQAYPGVRKEMRGRYPRHPWPENPLEHEATALTKRKLALQSGSAPSQRE